MKHCVLFLFTIFSLLASAQRGRQLNPLYIEGTAYKSSGWFIGPGITYMLPLDRHESLTMFKDAGDGQDTLYSGDFSRAGKIGLYLEAGRHKFLHSDGLINHIDYGIHFKMLRGRENFSGLSNTGVGMVPVESNSKFSDSFVGAFFNASNITQLADRFWIQNSMGANVDFRVITRHVGGQPYGAEWMYPSTLLGQLHYKLGFGWKPEPGIFIIPSIETPILNVYPWDDGRSTLQYFVGRDRPLILTLRIQWLSKEDQRTCEGQPGKNPKVDKDKPGKHENSSLWGPEGKKMKRSKRK